jgi:hypothetical protein
MVFLSKLASLNARAALARIRRHLGVLTESELRDAYLSEAYDRVDLERRLRDLDRGGQTAFPRNVEPFTRHR